MAGWLSTFGANAVLNGTAIPATLYAKPHVGNPGPAGANNAAGETTRKSFTRTTSTAGANSNAADMDWTAVSTTEDWTYLSLWDASSGGNCWGILPHTQNPLTAGDNVKIAAGDLDLALDIWA